MRLVTYLHTKAPQSPRLGAIINETIVDLQAACEWAQTYFPLPRKPIPLSMLDFVASDQDSLDYIRQALHNLPKLEDLSILRASGHDIFAFRPEDITLLPPLLPLSLRDAYAFEQHVRKASENRGRPVPAEWYNFPSFYYTNSKSVIGHNQPIRRPRYTQALDYELEIAAVIGKPGLDLSVNQAADAIFGFTIFNDWSARDVQRAEMKLGLGPAKGKDFSSSLGPCIITIDELRDRSTGRPGVFDLEMKASINGIEKSHANFKDIYWSFGEIIERVSNETAIYPGEVIGSGTVGTGCLLELTKGEGPWLEPGDVVELEVERIGLLRNTVI